jgi:hypothetical protein
MSRKLLLGAVSCFVLACGGAPPPEPKRAEAEPAVAPPPALPAVREASPELRRYWVFGKSPELALYGDLEGLLHSELFEALMPLALNASGELLRPKQQGCLQALLSSTRALAVGANERGSVALLELGNEGVQAARTACVGAAFPVDRIKVTGADEAYAADDNVVVVEPGVVLIGPKTLVEAALASKQGEPWPSGLALEAEQELKFVVDVKREVPVSASGVLSVGHEQLSATADVELPSEEIAQDIEAKIAGFSQANTTLAPPENLALLKRLVEAGSLERDGKHLKLAFRLHGPVREQVTTVGATSALAIFGVRKYLAKAKAAEARIAVAQIAKDYAVYFAGSEAAPKVPQKKQLFSLPAVPPTIPRGTKYQSSPDDWKAWQPLGFSFTDPQYYQYEIIAAKDGKSATIFARGDLNGDGKPSEFRLKLRLDPKTRALSIDPSLEEANPED